MPIRFQCDSCGKSLKADESRSGKRIRCPGCEETITIPDPEEEFTDADDEYDENSIHRQQPKTDRSLKTKKVPRKRNYPLATRSKRFRGAMLDNGVVLLPFALSFLLLMLLVKLFPQEPGKPMNPLVPNFCIFTFTILMSAVVIGNIVLIATRVSIGKWFLEMQIVDYESNIPAGFLKAFVLRSFVNSLISAVPFVGFLYTLLDDLFIFGDEQRCLHDHLAGTKVVDIS